MVKKGITGSLPAGSLKKELPSATWIVVKKGITGSLPAGSVKKGLPPADDTKSFS
jgi:hypothetical protein